MPETDETIKTSYQSAAGEQKNRFSNAAAEIFKSLLQQPKGIRIPIDSGSSVRERMCFYEEPVKAPDRSNELQKELLKLWAQGLRAINLDAYLYSVEGNPGAFRVRGYDEYGRWIEGSAKYVDGQAELPGKITSDQPSLMKETAVDDRKASDIVQDISISFDDRIEALQEWVLLDNDAAAAFILEELEKDDLQTEWRNALIYAAEDVRFSNENDQVRLCNRLRELALDLRERSEPNIERVVWTAIRRYASLIPEERANDLVDFLHQKGQVDTRLVALQGVVHIFEIVHPESLLDLQPLADRVFELTSKLIDPDIMTAGETTAIAEQGIHALAAIGDPRFEDCLTKLDLLEWQWLSRQVRKDLIELRSAWDSSDQDLATHPAYLQLYKVLEEREPGKYEQAR